MLLNGYNNQHRISVFSHFHNFCGQFEQKQMTQINHKMHVISNKSHNNSRKCWHVQNIMSFFRPVLQLFPPSSLKILEWNVLILWLILAFLGAIFVSLHITYMYRRHSCINIVVTLTCRLWWRTWWGAVGGGCCHFAPPRRSWGALRYPTAWCWGIPAPPWGARAHQSYNPPAWETTGHVGTERRARRRRRRRKGFGDYGTITPWCRTSKNKKVKYSLPRLQRLHINEPLKGGHKCLQPLLQITHIFLQGGQEGQPSASCSQPQC